jgi:uncharacterized SAM-binding protein YcdF (DUF218 family)
MPLPVFWILVILAVIFYFSRRRTSSRIFTIFSIIWLLTISTSFLPVCLVTGLENRYEVFNPDSFKQTDKPVHILVLGGGHSNDQHLPANSRLTEVALARLAEGIRLHRQITGSIIITSGWSSSGNMSQAEVLAETALLLGVDRAFLKMQTKPANTMGEAAEYKRLFGDSALLIVVTNAVHMRRAIYAFQKQGLDPVPAPTNHLIKKDENYNPWIGIPSSNNIRKMESAVHEYVGFLWYRLMGN